MRSPSGRLLINKIDIFPGKSQQDIDGGPQWIYDDSPTYSDVPASVQIHEVEEIVDEQNRVTRFFHYHIIMGTNPAIRMAFPRIAGQPVTVSPVLEVNPRDMIKYKDDVGNTRILFVNLVVNQAGRSRAWVIRATERQ